MAGRRRCPEPLGCCGGGQPCPPEVPPNLCIPKPYCCPDVAKYIDYPYTNWKKPGPGYAIVTYTPQSGFPQPCPDPGATDPCNRCTVAQQTCQSLAGTYICEGQTGGDSYCGTFVYDGFKTFSICTLGGGTLTKTERLYISVTRGQNEWPVSPSNPLAGIGVVWRITVSGGYFYYPGAFVGTQGNPQSSLGLGRCESWAGSFGSSLEYKIVVGGSITLLCGGTISVYSSV